jgi:hypothetical protein
VSAGGSVPHPREPWRGGQHLALDVHEGQRLPWVDHHRVRSRRAHASELAPSSRSTVTVTLSPLEIILVRIGLRRRGRLLPHCPEQGPGGHAPGARCFGRPKLRLGKSLRRRTMSRQCAAACAIVADYPRRVSFSGELDQGRATAADITQTCGAAISFWNPAFCDRSHNLFSPSVVKVFAQRSVEECKP